MNKRQLSKVTLGFIGSLIISSSVNATNLNIISNKILMNKNISLITESNLAYKVAQVAKVKEGIKTNSNYTYILNDKSVTNVTQIPVEENPEGDVDAPEGTDEPANGHAKIIDGVVNCNILNVRQTPSIDAPIITKLEKGDKVTQISDEGDWLAIETDSIKGYVAQQYISFGAEAEAITKSLTKTQTKVVTKKYVTIKVDVLNVRKTPSLNAKIVDKAYKSEQFEISQDLGEWIEVLTNDGKAYVFKEFVDITTQKLSKAATATSASSPVRQQVIDYAKKFVGNPYVYGGNSLTKGVDCSGFTQQIFKKFGYNLSRSSRTQYGDGIRIKKSELKPGDLVFYGYKGNISHVAIYIGSGKIIHASTAKTGIIIGNLDRSYGKPYIGAIRIIKD